MEWGGGFCIQINYYMAPKRVLNKSIIDQISHLACVWIAASGVFFTKAYKIESGPPLFFFFFFFLIIVIQSLIRLPPYLFIDSFFHSFSSFFHNWKGFWRRWSLLFWGGLGDDGRRRGEKC